MSIANPTPLRVGAAGALNGWRVRVAGRVVLGVEIDGATYYWNEFNLVDGFGRSATLVFEEGEQGPEWKLFKDFVPLRAVTASDAATKRVGDMVNLDGTPRRVTLADQSRVYHIEGTAPEGVEVGDIAHYFNVDTGERMLVASWSGEEIEFYEGHDIAAAQVAEAFGLPNSGPAMTPPELPRLAGAAGGSNLTTKFVGAALIGIILFGFFSCGVCSRNPKPVVATPSPVRQKAPALILTLGASGTVAKTTYTVDSHATLEISRVSGQQERHEYLLKSNAGQPALLINGLTGGPREWHILAPFSPSGPLATLTPHEAATRRKAGPVILPDRPLRIAELFQSRMQSGRGAAAQVWTPLQFGFVAREAEDWFIARWTETGIQFYRGGPVAEAAVLAAFGPGPERAR